MWSTHDDPTSISRPRPPPHVTWVSPYALVDHEALTLPDGSARAVARVTATGAAIYRGWMLRSEQYAGLADALGRRGVILRTAPDEYQAGHEFPGWYPRMASVTPQSVWTVGDGREDFERARSELGTGPAVLRDYTKSMKHYWHEAAFIPDLADATAAWSVASRFRQLRGDDFVGRVRAAPIRRVHRGRGAHLVGRWRMPDGHGTPGHLRRRGARAILIWEPIAPLIAALRLPFVTVDLARRTDGVWRVIELGDGQVSDRPASMPADAFVASLGLATTYATGDRKD